MMAASFTLYHYPVSYYSMKAQLALFEKDIDFKNGFIDIQGGGNNEPWYLQIHPDGKVPALKHGQTIVTESEKIIDYVDKQSNNVIILVPDVSIAQGQEVQRLRKLIDAIPIDLVSFGVLANQELSASGLQPPFSYMKLTRETILGRLQGTIKSLKEKMSTDTANSTYYERKAGEVEHRLQCISSCSQIADVLDTIEGVLDQLEERLQRSSKARSGSADTFWLVGSSYTAADILASVLFARLAALGLSARYMTTDKRPQCYSYQQRLFSRSAFKKSSKLAKHVPWIMMRTKLKRAMPKVAKLGTIAILVGTAAYLCKKYDVVNLVQSWLTGSE